MGVLYNESGEQKQRPAAPAMFLVHIHRPDAGTTDPALCGNRFGAYVTAHEDEAVPYIIGRVETLCAECRAKQFTV